MSTSATSKSFSSVEALRDAIVSPGRPQDEAWTKRMVHTIPELPTVKDRAAYLVAKAAGRVVLDIGCTGPISARIRAAAKGYHGIDRVFMGEGCYHLDVDRFPHIMPRLEDVEVVICSEVLEHLANPGNFLQSLRQLYPTQPVYFTVPNAGAYLVREGSEIVHEEHVAWYSYQTLKTLLARYNYAIAEARWYNGQPYKAEGLIVVAK